MLETLNRKIRNIDMSDVKSRVGTIGAHAKVHALNIGTYAKQGARYVGTKRVVMAGRSVNPFLVGAAVALIGTATYLILKRRNNNRMRFAGYTEMDEQMQPAK